jgi:anti-anti-sigma regulatory factor
MSTNIVFDRPTDGVIVARFARPDLRDALDDHGHAHDDISNCELYQQLHAGAVALLPEGGALILNFGLVEVFVSAFFRLLIRTREDLRAKHGRLLLCGMSPLSSEPFQIMGGPRLFETYTTEPRALAAAKS